MQSAVGFDRVVLDAAPWFLLGSDALPSDGVQSTRVLVSNTSQGGASSAGRGWSRPLAWGVPACASGVSWMPVAVAWSPECCVSNHQNALWAPSHTSEPISADDTQVTRGSHACRWHCRDLGSGPELQAMHGTVLLAPNHRPSGACTGPCQHRCSPILCSCQLW